MVDNDVSTHTLPPIAWPSRTVIPNLKRALPPHPKTLIFPSFSQLFSIELYPQKRTTAPSSSIIWNRNLGSMLPSVPVISRISLKNTKSNWQKTNKALEENSDMLVLQIVAVDVVQHLSRRETIFSRLTIS